jgi:hypothetical protein
MMPFRRLSGLSGLAFVVVFGGIQFTSAEPSRTASQEEITRYLAGHQTSNEVGGVLAVLVSGFLALFAIGVWTLLRSSRDAGPAWPMTALVGGVVMSVNLAFLGASIAAQGLLGDKLAAQPVLAQAVFVSEQTLGTAILPFIALLLLGAGMAALESGAMPAWTAWLAFAGAALSVVLTLQLAYAGPVLVAVGVVHALAAIGWIAVASVYLLLPERRAMVASAGIA